MIVMFSYVDVWTDHACAHYYVTCIVLLINYMYFIISNALSVPYHLPIPLSNLYVNINHALGKCVCPYDWCSSRHWEVKKAPCFPGMSLRKVTDKQNLDIPWRTCMLQCTRRNKNELVREYCMFTVSHFQVFRGKAYISKFEHRCGIESYRKERTSKFWNLWKLFWNWFAESTWDVWVIVFWQ